MLVKKLMEKRMLRGVVLGEDASEPDGTVGVLQPLVQALQPHVLRQILRAQLWASVSSASCQPWSSWKLYDTPKEQYKPSTHGPTWRLQPLLELQVRGCQLGQDSNTSLADCNA